MDILDAIQKRRSVRSYSDQQLSDQELSSILEAGRLAPSGKNRQDLKFIVAQKPETKRKLAKAAGGQSFLAEASAVVAGVSLDPESLMRCGISRSKVDVTIALDHLTLQAAEQGIGTCWIGAFDQQRVKQILDIPDQYKVVALMPIGVPEQELRQHTKERKDLTEIVSYESF